MIPMHPQIKIYEDELTKHLTPQRIEFIDDSHQHVRLNLIGVSVHVPVVSFGYVYIYAAGRGSELNAAGPAGDSPAQCLAGGRLPVLLHQHTT
jgi:hypothetical protein